MTGGPADSEPIRATAAPDFPPRGGRPGDAAGAEPPSGRSPDGGPAHVPGDALVRDHPGGAEGLSGADPEPSAAPGAWAVPWPAGCTGNRAGGRWAPRPVTGAGHLAEGEPPSASGEMAGPPPGGADESPPETAGPKQGFAEDARGVPPEPAAARTRAGQARGAAGRRSRKDVHALGWEEARGLARGAGEPAARAVAVPLDAAAGAVLVEPLRALTDLPAFDTSAMDGWAVAGSGPWMVSESGVLAGHGGPAALRDGQAVPIATGARVPAGTAAVLRSEHGELRDGRLRSVSTPPVRGADVRPRGQECRAGDRLLPVGTRVTPPVLGLAAAAGHDELRVVPAPRVEFLVLGDELLHSGPPHGGRVRDALGPMVGPWLAALGAVVTAVRRLPDDPDTLFEAVRSSPADLVVTSGGTAAGPADHVHPVLRRLGARMLVDGVAVRPGHPMLLAALPHRGGGGAPGHLIGLPGNPLAAVSGLFVLVAPLLRARLGRAEPSSAPAPLTADVPGHPRDTRVVPAVRTAAGAAEPLCYAGPAMLRGMAAAHALAVIPPGGAPAGTPVRLLELPW